MGDGGSLESGFRRSLVMKPCRDDGKTCKLSEKSRRKLVHPYREKLYEGSLQTSRALDIYVQVAPVG